MSRKLWNSLLAVLVASALLLSACAPAATTEAPAAPAEPAAPTTAAPAEPTATTAAAEPVAEATAPAATEEPAAPAAEAGPYDDVDPTGQQIFFWHNHTKGRQDALEAIVQEFNSTNEWGIKVTQENQGSYGDIFKKMLPILNSGDVPALVVAYQNQAATYQLSGGLIDMRPLVDSAKWGIAAEDQQDFFPGFWAQDVFPNFDNARLGFPPNRSMEVMYYNMDWLTELGFDAPPATPEEFREMACAASQQGFSNATAEGPVGYELSIDASRFASWAFAFGGDVFDSETGQYTYNNEGAVQAMEFLQGLFRDGCATLVTEAYGDQTDFGTGKLLFSIGSSSGLPFYRSAVDEGGKFEWGVAAIPHTTADPVMNIYGASVSIPKNTPQQELAAWLFLKYYTSPEVQAEWAQASEYFPVRASVADGLEGYFEQQPAYKTAFEMLEYGKFEPPTPGYDFVREMVNTAMATIVADPYPDVQPVLDQLNEEANANLEDQLSQMTTQ
jgi:multiple sugar transport system substrate-binding protein/sn-glycerol 3-phosphate transport system substrate-binding protein